MKCKYKKNLCETQYLMNSHPVFAFLIQHSNDLPSFVQLLITQSTLSSVRKSLYRFYPDRE
jgi:hypothetical protein